MGRSGAIRLGGLLQSAISLILPPVCLGCRAPVQGMAARALCADCFGAMTFVGSPQCMACGAPFAAPAAVGVCEDCARHPPVWNRARAAVLYDDGSKPLILGFKHADRTDLAPTLAAWMARAGAELLADAEMILPVPLHRWRLYGRRYNQAALLARGVSRLSGVPSRPDALIRSRATPSQGELGRRARMRNIAGAFVLNPSAGIEGKRLLLIDDVLTTGATVSECVRVLQAGGAAAVDVLTLARVGAIGEEDGSWNG